MEGKCRERLRVAIIGAGAVGLYLAWRLSRQGHYVVVYEKKLGIKAKACSGLVSERVRDFVPGMDDLVENKISGCRIHFSRKTVQLQFKPALLCVSRQELNERLFHLAKKPGTSFVWMYPFSRIKDRIERFDRIIGCDGAYSQVRKALGLPDPKMKLGIQAFIDKQDYSNYTDTWPVQGGFFWRIPRGEYVEYGIMGDRASAYRDFSRFTEELGVADLLGRNSASIPQGLCLPHNSKVTLCGDAAGLTKPWSGGGLLWGFRAVDILADCFLDFDLYRERARRVFLPQIIAGKALTVLIRYIGDTMPFLFPSGIRYDNDFIPLFRRSS